MGCGHGFVFWVKLASGTTGALMMLISWPSISCPKGRGWSMCGEAQLRTLFLGLLRACLSFQPPLLLHLLCWAE